MKTPLEELGSEPDLKMSHARRNTPGQASRAPRPRLQSWVTSIARAYENLGLPLPILLREGNIGLLRAVEKFQAGNGGRLADCTHGPVHQSIRRALASQVTTLRLPMHAGSRAHKARRPRP